LAFTALFDACVLYPAPLRDPLLRLACTTLFRARWSYRIHEEWMRGVLRSRPELADKLPRTRDMMNKAVPDRLVVGWEGMEGSFDLPDPGDRHVLAAAVVGRADVIVTFNLKHFPPAALAPYGVEAQHPDMFIRHVLNLDAEIALPIVRNLRVGLRAPTQTTEQYLGTLLRQGLPETVAFLRPWAAMI